MEKQLRCNNPKEGKWLRCSGYTGHTGCGYEWSYKGQFKEGHVTTCPRCRGNVTIKPLPRI